LPPPAFSEGISPPGWSLFQAILSNIYLLLRLKIALYYDSAKKKKSLSLKLVFHGKRLQVF
jgi:hypothetical protein